ncbi:Cys-Gln thioester bond-forming surface protein [Streptomyces liangshanensis]|uniref:Cys-Gln thioester bond-forming surface protein n=1 Tax=Streptomyces liangshanensis TaxID=2717324 RepID=UPI0036D82AED
MVSAISESRASSASSGAPGPAVSLASAAPFARSAWRRGAARLAAAVLLPGLLAVGTLAGAGTAAADDVPQHLGGASATLDGLKTFGGAVLHTAGGDQELPAGLFEMTVEGGGTLKTYCIDIHNPTQAQAKYQETPWAQTSLGANDDAGRIRWILEHSYPQVDDLAHLAAVAKTGPLTDQTAAAGTQVAIWRFSDGADVDASDPAAEKLADWLEKNARDTPEPAASLTLDSAAVSGRAGERLGPVTVRTNADRVTVTPPVDVGVADVASAAGVKITDKAGKEVTTATNGSQLFFDVPAGADDGTASLAVQATTSVPVGRAFAGVTRSQTQILAGSSDSTVSATATATWAASGAIPAISAAKNCARSGVDVTVANEGDAEFTFELAGDEHAVAPGESRTVTVPVVEDQPYEFAVNGPDGLTKTFKGVLDCRTTGTAPPPDEQITTQLGTDSEGAATAGLTDNLAETGSSSATPLIAGIAIALVALGGAAIFLLRKRKPTPPTD